MNNYADFLQQKQIHLPDTGIEVAGGDLHPRLFPFQRDIARWALRKGRAAIFADCGMGKTLMQLDWGYQIWQRRGGKILIFAPLAVASQTQKEASLMGYTVHRCYTQSDVQEGLNITNYDRLHHFSPEGVMGIILDESAILKGFDGKTRKALNDFAETIPFRLACTATPAPNDLVELINHAEFLGIMSGKEMIALFFTQDGNTTHAWRLKGHAREPFWRWMASWAVALRKPSDLGYDDGEFVLPACHIQQHVVDAKPLEHTLFPVEAVGLQAQQKARRSSLIERVQAAAYRVNTTPGYWVVWCNLNSESHALVEAIPDAVELQGSASPLRKEQVLQDFGNGAIRVLVTKPSIAGFGLNWQHCHQMAFVGLSNSYEQIYQALRRCWRFGQQSPVDVWFIIAETEGSVATNIQRKEHQAMEMMDQLVAHMNLEGEHASMREEMVYEEEVAGGKGWTIYLGDSVETMGRISDNSIGHVVTSPPFPGMYAYTNSIHDMGNVPDVETMLEQFRFLVDRTHLYRILMPGRIAAIHLTQLTAMRSREGWIGIKDYRGGIIRLMQDEGWIYHGEVTVEKNPQVQAVRNKERGLLFKSLATDSAVMRMALADYIIFFRKPGENPVPIRAGQSPKYNPQGGWITEDEWIEWASPVWYRKRAGIPGGIQETDVLNVRQARETDDERHLAPLQLGVIERCIKLFSAPGETIYDPFTGIGSTGYMALKLQRKFIGGELKRSYWQSAQENIRQALYDQQQVSLFAEGFGGEDSNALSEERVN